LRQRGRTANKKKLKKDKQNPRWFHQHTPLKYADNLGIYLLAKTKNKQGRVCMQTLGIETIRLSDWYREQYWSADKNNKSVHRINQDVLPFLQTAVSKLAELTGYKEGA